MPLPASTGARSAAPRPPLSAVVVAYNCGDRIATCLRSLAFADEIVVVDSGSDDDTREVARRHGAVVVVEPWRGYGPQKRFATERAAHDWVLSIDSDEEVTPPLAAAIDATLRDARCAAYAMPRANRFLGRFLAHGEGFPDWSVRLFDRRRARWSDDAVHEKVVATGPVGRLPIDAVLLHRSAESLAQYLDKQNRYTTLQAEALAASGARAGALRMIGSPALRFVKFYVLKLGFLDGIPGLVHIAIGCFNSFAKYAKLQASRDARATARDAGADAPAAHPVHPR